MHLTHLECTECGSQASATELATVCSACRMPLVARYDLDAASRSLTLDSWLASPGKLWDLAAVMPLAKPDTAVSLGEGGTPLLKTQRLAAELGLSRLWVKEESQNPTGSFKARGMSAAVSAAVERGAQALAVPSAGNAGGALAAYGARAGLPVHLAMPEDVPAANRIEALACGAKVTLLPGTISDCGHWIAEQASLNGWFNLSTLKEPYRVEGKKSMGYELLRDLGGHLPDVILYPAGGGTGLVGMWKAFDEMESMGWLPSGGPRPRMVAVQAAGCAPVVEALHAGRDDIEVPDQPATCASGLRVPAPIGGRWMLRVLRASQGTAIAINDADLVAGSRRIGATEGIFAAPEGGALVAALEQLIASSWIQPEEEVVLFDTGTGLKYLECFED